MKNILIVLLFSFLFNQLNAQNVLASVNQKISGKAAIGEWVDYSVNSESNSVSFSFQTKKSKRVAKFEHYKFNLDLDYQGMEEEEIELEKIRTRFRLFAPKGDAPLLRVKKNWLSGQMIMETGHISYSYAGRALITNFVVDQKMKPKGGDGEKLLLIHARTESPFYYSQMGKKFFGQNKDMKRSRTMGSGADISHNEGDVCALVYEKSDPKFQNYSFVVYDAKSFERKLTTKIKLPYAMRPTYVRDMPNGDMALIFAPVLKVDLPKSNKANDYKIAPASNYKYMRVNMKGEVMDDVDLSLQKNKVGQPYTLAIIPDSDPASTNAFIVGYGNPDFLGGGGLQEATASWAATNGNTIPRATNYTAGKIGKVILAKIQNNKLAYLTKVTPDQFFQNTESNGAKTPSGKDAGKFFLANLIMHQATTINGKDLLIGNASANGTLFVTQMDQKGALEKVYLNTPIKSIYFADAALVEHADGGARLIYTYQPQGKSAEENRAKEFERVLQIIELNPSKGTIGNPIDILPKKHFVDAVDPFRFLNNNEILVLGHSSRKDITLVKVKL